jgi:predicted N-acetyltransferase YhbS
MPTLTPAEGPLLDQILEANYDIWNEGLSRPAYRKWWTAQLATSWGREHLRRTALVDGGDVLASAKEYLFTATLDGRTVRVLGLGAVFTQPAHRGRGSAAALIEQLIARASANGCDLALLFSEIGPAYYERLGFSVLPMFDLELRVAESTRHGAPATLVRAGDDSDFDAAAAMNRVRAEPFRFSLHRDRDLISYAIAKKRLRAGLGPPGMRELQFFAAEEGASAVAYVVIGVDNADPGVARPRPSSGGPVWTIEECGDRDPSGARVGAMLQVLLAREPSIVRPRIRAWLPHGFTPPQITVADRRPSSDVMMVRPLTAAARSATTLEASQIFYWRNDLF